MTGDNMEDKKKKDDKKKTAKKKTAKSKKSAGEKSKSPERKKKPKEPNKSKQEEIIPEPVPEPDNKVEESAGVLAITSLIVGICSIILCCGPLHLILGIAAIILGFIEHRNIEQGESPEKGKNLALAGIITGTLGLFFFILRVFGWFGLSALSFLENIIN